MQLKNYGRIKKDLDFLEFYFQNFYFNFIEKIKLIFYFNFKIIKINNFLIINNLLPCVGQKTKKLIRRLLIEV